MSVLCTKCGHECGEEEYKIHAENGCKTLRCSQCPEFFTNKNALNKHTRAVHNKEYECTTCQKHFGCKFSLQKHQFLKHNVIYNKKKAQQCENCGEVFAGKYFLKLHVQKAHTTELVCRICECAFASMFNLKKHMQNVHKSELTAADEPETSKVPKTECSECGELMDIRYLKRHLRARHGQSTSTECPKCGELIDKRYLKRHLREKHGPCFACNVCGKQYQSEKTLQNHVERRKHAGEDIKEEVLLKQKYKCHLCPRRCAAAWNLKVHLRAIHGEVLKKKFKCHLCPRKFSATWNLKAHVKTEHGQKLNCRTSKILLADDSETENSETNSESSEEDYDIDDDLPLATLKSRRMEPKSSEEDRDTDDELPLASVKITKMETKSSEEDNDTDDDLPLTSMKVSKTEPKSSGEEHNNDGDSSDYDALPFASVEIKIEEGEENTQETSVQQIEKHASIENPKSSHGKDNTDEDIKHYDELPLALVKMSKMEPKTPETDDGSNSDNDELPLATVEMSETEHKSPERDHVNDSDYDELPLASVEIKIEAEQEEYNQQASVDQVKENSSSMQTSVLCPKCGQKCSEMEYRIHAESNCQSVKCPECSQLCANAEALFKHTRAVHNKEFQCTICQKFFACKYSLQRHQLCTHKHIYNVKKAQKCVICGEVFVGKYFLKRHIQTVHCKVLVCHVCKEQFASYYTLRNHMQRKHQDVGIGIDGQKIQKVTKIPCPKCKKLIDKRSLDRHLRIKHSQSFICHVCQKEFLSEKILQRHIKCHNPKQTFPCHACEKEFPSEKTLKKHNDYWHGEDISEEALMKKKYKCQLCPQRFTASWTLKTHIKARHEGEYKCDVCEKLFSAPFPLARHRMNVHGLETENQKPQKKSKSPQEDQPTDTRGKDNNDPLSASVCIKIEEGQKEKN